MDIFGGKIELLWRDYLEIDVVGISSQLITVDVQFANNDAKVRISSFYAKCSAVAVERRVGSLVGIDGHCISL